jgi:cytochrome b561
MALANGFWDFPVRAVHYSFSRLLTTLIGLHVLGAAHHTFVRRDGLLGRTSFGRRMKSPQANNLSD